MTDLQNYLLSVSFLLWGAVILVAFIRHKRAYLLPGLVQLAMIAGVIIGCNRYFGYFDGIQRKFTLNYNELVVIFALYLATVAGIAGKHFFVQIKGLNERGRQRTIKFLPLLRPLIISPIIFLPVLAQFNQMGVQIDTATALLVQLILAFQNGFFWKTILDHVGKSYETAQKT